MEETPNINSDITPQANNFLPDLSAGTEKKNVLNTTKGSGLTAAHWLMLEQLPGVYCKGVQYFDLYNVRFISHSVLAKLIYLLKSLKEKGVEVEFVNVNERIKEQFKKLGLDHIITCS